MKKILVFASVLAIGLTYFVNANAPVLILKSEVSTYKNVQSWLSTDALVPIPLPTPQEISSQSKPQYFFSDSRNYYGKMIHNNQQIEVSWYDADHVQHGSLNEEWPHDVPLPRYYINSNNNHIFSIDIFNRIRFFNSDGKIENEIPLFKNLTYNNENNTYCQYMEQMDQLIIGVKQVYAVSDKEQGYNSYLALIDLDGNEIFSISFPGWQINGVSASTNGDYFLIPLHKFVVKDEQFIFRTLLVDNQGRIIDDIPLQHNRAVFNMNGSLAAFFKNEQAWLYDIAKNKIIRDYPIADSDKIYLSGLFIDEKNILVLQEGEVYKEDLNWAFREMKLDLINYDGLLIEQHDLKDITQFTPVLKYDAMKEQLFIGHRAGYQYYRINSKH
jgi:hypothetical protein